MGTGLYTMHVQNPQQPRATHRKVEDRQEQTAGLGWEAGWVLDPGRPGIPLSGLCTRSQRHWGGCPDGCTEETLHQTGVLGGPRQLLCGGWIWLGVLGGCVEGTVDALQDPLSWAWAPLPQLLGLGYRQPRVIPLFRELLSA